MEASRSIRIEFITESLPCSLIGMNSIEMIKYIQYIAESSSNDARMLENKVIPSHGWI